MFPQAPLPLTLAQRKLAYLANRRAMAEMERLLYRFLVAELITLTDAECLQLETLLLYDDADLLDWMAGLKPKPPEVSADSLARLFCHAQEPHVQ